MKMKKHAFINGIKWENNKFEITFAQDMVHLEIKIMSSTTPNS